MPTRKNQTLEEQSERFRQEAQKRIDSGMLSAEDADAEMDARVKKSIRDHGA